MEPPAGATAGDEPRCRARRSSGAAGDGRRPGSYSGRGHECAGTAQTAHFIAMKGSSSLPTSGRTPSSVWRSSDREAAAAAAASTTTASAANSNAAAASIFPSLSPRIFLHLAVYSGTVAISTEKYTEGLHPERPARGAVLSTGQSRPCIEHKGPPSTKNMHTKRRP